MTSTLDRPNHAAVHGPAEVRAAMAEISDAASMRAWDEFLDRVYAKGIETGSFEKLQEFLDSSWRSVLAYRDFEVNGPPPREGRITREQFIAEWEARNDRAFPTAA